MTCTDYLVPIFCQFEVGCWLSSFSQFMDSKRVLSPGPWSRPGYFHILPLFVTAYFSHSILIFKFTFLIYIGNEWNYSELYPGCFPDMAKLTSFSIFQPQEGIFLDRLTTLCVQNPRSCLKRIIQASKIMLDGNVSSLNGQIYMPWLRRWIECSLDDSYTVVLITHNGCRGLEFRSQLLCTRYSMKLISLKWMES